MKKKCLLILKWPIFLNNLLINKFSKFYEVEHLYIENFKNETYSEITEKINELIVSKKIEIVFFDVDFIKFINLFFINKIKNVKKAIITFDDYALHEMNAITATGCDIVLTHCPFSQLKYKEKGFESYCMCIENDGEIFKNYNTEKEIDVLFFGRLNPDRKEIIDYISNNGISVKLVGQENNFVSDEEIAKLISKSKIVLNLSKSTGKTVINYANEDTYKFWYLMKGRVIQAGLCGTLCVSEFSPGQELMYNNNELPTFYSKEECLEKIKNFLNNKSLLEEYTKRFSNKTINSFEEKTNFQPIFNALEKKISKKVNLYQIPYWYLRIAAKQIILKNIHITRLLKKVPDFKEVFYLIKDCSLKSKIMIFFESICNILWYSIIISIKKRKRNLKN